MMQNAEIGREARRLADAPLKETRETAPQGKTAKICPPPRKYRSLEKFRYTHAGAKPQGAVRAAVTCRRVHPHAVGAGRRPYR